MEIVYTVLNRRLYDDALEIAGSLDMGLAEFISHALGRYIEQNY